MRTLAQMIEQVKVHVRGRENLSWKQSDYENVLSEAARRMWRNLLETPGRKCLRSQALLSVDASGSSFLPSDCLRVEEIQYKYPYGGEDWIGCPYVLPRSTSNGMFYFPSTVTSWTDGDEEREIRMIWLPPETPVRLLYYAEPVFPFESGGTFRRPDGGSSDSYPGVPEMADSACEHLAAALLMGNETSDPDPSNYHGNQYNSMLRMMSGALAVKPSRSYVKHVWR